jgi:MazG family protein
MEDASQATGAGFQRLVDIMARLRAPGGCPWDREQTFDSIKKYTLEETYEVLDAIDRRDWADLRDELGDFLLQAVFYAQMASEEKLFDIGASLDAINEKLIRRHPHIFADGDARTEADVKKRWDEIKAQERAGKKDAPQGLLDTVPRALPALVEAQQITSRAAGVGFDWGKPEEVLEKLHEELAEFEAARRGESQADIEDELGDLLFTIVNLARFVKVDPEQALRRTNTKFRGRFGYIERRLGEQDRKVSETPVARLEELWLEAKTAPEVRPEAGKTAAERNTGESKSKP